MENIIVRILKTLTWIVIPFVIRLEVVGRENFPPDGGPYILVVNHLAFVDTPILFAVCPHRISALVGARHRKNLIFGTLLGLAGVIWLRRGMVDREALRAALAWLEAGGILGVAPEGTRSRGAWALQEAKLGAAYLATRSNVPILPVGMTGTEKIRENFPRRRTRVRIVVGELFRLPEHGRVRSEKLQVYTDQIMRQIAALLPEEYRGVYA